MDPLPETRTRFKNNGPAASRRRFWTRGDGFDGPSRIERSIHSTGIVVPLPTHYRKDAHSACRVSSENIVKSAAALVLRMEKQDAQWSTLLNGFNFNIEIVRSRKSRPLKSYVRVHLHSECVQ